MARDLDFRVARSRDINGLQFAPSTEPADQSLGESIPFEEAEDITLLGNVAHI